MNKSSSKRNFEFKDPNICFISNGPPCGKVLKIVGRPDGFEVHGVVNESRILEQRLDTILVLDGANRFVTMANIAAGRWVVKIFPTLVGNDKQAVLLQFYACNEESNEIFQLGIDAGLAHNIKEQIFSWRPKDMVDVPTLKPALRDLISSAIKVPYTSKSIHDAITTGNAYQTLALGGGVRTPGRDDRSRMLRSVDFRDKVVLDIGANMGEISRSARLLGASLVDGYEYDPYFVEIGRMVNALVGSTRVSLFQADCTKASIFAGKRYDIILALNVWVYIDKCIQALAEVAPLMVFETHTLDHGMNFYYDRILPHYQHAACIGLTDVQEDPHKARAFIVFAHDKSVLATSVRREYVQVEPYFRNIFIERHGSLNQQQVLDLSAACFDRVRHLSSDKWREFNFGSVGYFEMLLAGLSQFKNAGAVMDDNIYLRFLVDLVKAGRIDKKIEGVINNPKWIRRKVANKFEDIINIIGGREECIVPIKLIEAKEAGEFSFFRLDGSRVACSEIDGHHRFFAFQLAGKKKIQCTFS